MIQKKVLKAIKQGEKKIDSDDISEIIVEMSDYFTTYRIKNWNEVKFHDYIVEYCHAEYNDYEFLKVAKNFSVGGALGLKIDIDFNNGDYGLEIKLVKAMTTSKLQSLLGQVLYYQKRKYTSKNMGVLFIGSIPSDKASVFKEVFTMLNEMNVSVFHIVNEFTYNDYTV